jgi:hypothetical protein
MAEVIHRVYLQQTLDLCMHQLWERREGAVMYGGRYAPSLDGLLRRDSGKRSRIGQQPNQVVKRRRFLARAFKLQGQNYDECYHVTIHNILVSLLSGKLYGRQ